MMNDFLPSQRFASQAGIAIGPILFVLALLAILAGFMASGIGNYSTASVADRVTADVASQASLIRAKILECNQRYRNSTTNYDGYPSSDATNGTLVSALDCSDDPAGQQNLWTGIRPTVMPHPTNGFGDWYYINTNASGYGSAAVGGRCIWTVPTGANPSGDQGLVQGLSMAANKFTSATAYSSSAEVIYDPASASQKFVLWITLPTGTPDSHCLP